MRSIEQPKKEGAEVEEAQGRLDVLFSSRGNSQEAVTQHQSEWTEYTKRMAFKFKPKGDKSNVQERNVFWEKTTDYREFLRPQKMEIVKQSMKYQVAGKNRRGRGGNM